MVVYIDCKFYCLTLSCEHKILYLMIGIDTRDLTKRIRSKESGCLAKVNIFK